MKAVLGVRRPRLLAVLFTVMAPVLAFSAVRTAAYEATGFRADLSGALPPESLWVDVKRVMRSARLPRRPVPPDTGDISLAAAKAYPLAFEPYFLAARVQERAGRYGNATKLMDDAGRQDPDYLATLDPLLSYYSLSNAYQQAIDEADVAMRVNPRTEQYILPAFAQLVARDQRARQAIATALARQPGWDDTFFRVAANSAMKPEDAARLVEDVRRRGRVEASVRRAQDAFLVTALVNAGRFAAARDHWLGTLAASADRSTLVADSRFNTQSLPPFGWELSSTNEGVAERTRPRGAEPPHLEVSYFGSAPAVLANQLLVLGPGTYRLSTTAQVTGSGEDAALSWRVLCQPGDRPIATMPLSASSRRQRLQSSFSVPAGCAAQKLVLQGTPADLPRTVSAQIFSVDITRAVRGEGRP